MKKIIDWKKLPKAFVDIITLLLFILALIYVGLVDLCGFLAWFGEDEFGLPDYGHPTNLFNVIVFAILWWTLLAVALLNLSEINLIQKYLKGYLK